MIVSKQRRRRMERQVQIGQYCTIECNGGGCFHKLHILDISNDMMAEHAIKVGWTENGPFVYCPECSKKKESK